MVRGREAVRTFSYSSRALREVKALFEGVPLSDPRPLSSKHPQER
jgi:hypothetical protein